MARANWRWWLRFSLGYLLIGVVFLPAMHHFWWDRHPGSQSRFVWYMVGLMFSVAVAFLIRFYVKEYWSLFFNSSQEEQHGIQR